MRSTTDFFGLLAYLTLMYGRLPDREMLNAAYIADDEDEQTPRQLTLVVVPRELPDDEVGASSVAA